jgi:hypothetical protein
MSSGSKKKEPRYVCLSEAKASHSHRTWTEFSSSIPHFLQNGVDIRKLLIDNPTSFGSAIIRDNINIMAKEPEHV